MTIITVTLHPAIDRVVRVSRLRPNEIARCKIEMVHGGGKGNNAARALTRLGVQVIATGFQGGYSGAFISDKLTSEGIRTAFVTCKQPTRISTLVQEDQTGNTYPLYEPGQTVEQFEIDALFERFETLLEEASLCLLCGSGQTNILVTVYARMIEVARQRGVRCLLDSSGDALAQGIQARPFMAKVNRHELSGYLGRPLKELADQVQAMLEIQERGIEIVALSRGEAGMLSTDGNQVWEGRLNMDKIINVVGCGDSQLAGIAKSILEDADLQEIVRWGVACGTANTQVRGAGFIDLEIVEALLPKVRLRQIPR